MNVGDEKTVSCWMSVSPEVEAPALSTDEICDVVVVGSGIAGLSVAYEVARFGKSVIVIDRGRIGAGMTARTTAHLASELDDFYCELIRARSEDEARLYHDSQVAAINRIEAICRDEAIAADFARVDGYLIAGEESHRALLEDEFKACRKIGVEVDWADRGPMPALDSGKALRFPNQARFHPTKYLSGLVEAIVRLGGRFYSETAHVADDETGEGVEITTEVGAKIRAQYAVFATNSPTNDKVAIHAKQIPNRTYALSGPVPKGNVPDALLWDTFDAYHYVRIQPLSENDDLLIVGGEDHRSGEASDMTERLSRLEQWARDRYPSLGSISHRWSGQVMEPMDFMPYSGLNPGQKKIFVHTGDSGQGITNAVAGSLTILPLILGEESRYAPLFDPARKSFGLGPLKEFAAGQADVVKNFAEYVGPADIGSVDELKEGEGAVIREGLKRIAAYKDENGAITKVSAICTHLGCLVHWNTLEKCWDCPCHGSQFSPDGEVLNGPAVQALKPAK